MPMKESGESDLLEIDRFDGGVGWIAYPSETVQRASHALATPAGALVIDPVDAAGVDDLLAAVGEVAAVLVLLDRHERDAVDVAERHDVPVAAPSWMHGVEGRDGNRPTALRAVLEGTGYEPHELLDTPVWQEVALRDPARGTLVVPEALGTAAYFRTSDERVGVHPLLRLTPPRSLAGLGADRLRVGHGEGLASDAGAAIDDAIAGSRARSPRLYLDILTDFVRG